MTTIGAHLTSLTPCASDYDEDNPNCHTSTFFWMQADVKTTVACGSITYAEKFDVCANVKLAKFIYIPDKIWAGFDNQHYRGCHHPTIKEEVESCNRQRTSRYEEIYDLIQPKDRAKFPEEINLKWCQPCGEVSSPQPSGKVIKGICSLYSYYLFPGEYYGAHKPGGEIYFFPPPEDSRDLCATVPNMKYHNGTSRLLAPSKKANNENIQVPRSAITMGKTMYEGTVYLRYSSVGAQTTFWPPNPDITGYRPPNVSTGSIHSEVWLELKSEAVSSIRPLPYGFDRSYPINYGVSSLVPHIN
jgi:hypothetical protein